MGDLPQTLGKCLQPEPDFSNISFCLFFPEHCGPDKPIIKLETGEFVAKLVSYLLVFVSSFFGNIMVILVVGLYRSKMQSSAYIYLLNLSVAGLIIALGCMWPYFMVSVAYEYPLGAAMCKLHPFLQLTSMVSSVLTLATIALDQFVAVAFPIHARFTSRLQPSWVISGVWVLAASASIPFLLHKKHIELRFSDHVKLSCSEVWESHMVFDPSVGGCVRLEPGKTAYYSFITAALFFVPVGVMIVAYAVIMWKVWSTQVPGENPAYHAVHSKSKAKIIKLVAAVLVGFILCWMPLQVLILFERYRPESGELPEWFSQFSYFAHFIAYANSAINPLIYCFMNGKFRQGFMAVLTCQKSRMRKGSMCENNSTFATLNTEATSRRSSRGASVSFHISNHSISINAKEEPHHALRAILSDPN